MRTKKTYEPFIHRLYAVRNVSGLSVVCDSFFYRPVFRVMDIA